jgi:hypothetical protein
MISVDLLKTFGFFKGFSNGELEKFAEIATEESYKAGLQKGRSGKKPLPGGRGKDYYGLGELHGYR